MLEDVFFAGSRWGRLTVVSRVPAAFAPAGGGGYNFRCDCGNELIRRPYQIRAMKAPMCVSCAGKAKGGKPNLKNRIDPLQRTINEQWNTFRKVARAKGDQFLSKESWLKVVTSNCAYCGAQPSNIRRASVPHAKDFCYGGIDRIDPEVGYIEGNCIPSCWPCNRMKGNLSQTEFLGHLWKVINFNLENIEKDSKEINSKDWRYSD